MLSPDQERIRSILYETITSICKNGLCFENELRIDGLIGITIDQQEVFLITVNEKIEHCGDYSICKTRKSTNIDKSSKIESAVVRQPCETLGSVCAKSLRKSDNLNASSSRQEYFPEPGSCNQIVDQRCRSASEDIVTDFQLNGNKSSSESFPDAVTHRDNSMSGEPSLESQPGDSSTTNCHVPIISRVLSGRQPSHDSVKNGNTRQLSDDDNDSNDSHVILVKQEQSSSNIMLDCRSIDTRPGEYVFEDAFSGFLPTVSSAFLQRTIEDNPCKYSGKHPSSMAASFNQRMVPLRKYNPLFRRSSESGNIEVMNDTGGMSGSHTDVRLPCEDFSDSSQFYERRRSLLSPYQISRLNKAFLQSQYLTSEMKTQLATELQMSASVIRSCLSDKPVDKRHMLSAMKESIDTLSVSLITFT